MRPNQLFSASMEPELDQWLSRFTNLEELFSSRAQLYAKLSGQQLEGTIDEQVTIIGSVYVGPNTQVKSGALLTGPLIVGPNSTIGFGAKVLGRTFIGAGSQLASGAVISNSILMNGCSVGPNCVVQNSILGFGVTVRAGSLVGDSSPEDTGTYVGDGSELGLGCIIFPGSIVQRNKEISAGEVVRDRA